MSSSPEYLEHVLSLLKPIDNGISARAFGGYGLYKGDVMFGIITWDSLYFKVDDTNRQDFQKAGSKPFVYVQDGRPTTMSYWEVPGTILSDKEELAAWMDKARAAATASKAKKEAKQKAQ